jgi:hypothetical protein
VYAFFYGEKENLEKGEKGQHFFMAEKRIFPFIAEKRIFPFPEGIFIPGLSYSHLLSKFGVLVGNSDSAEYNKKLCEHL